MGPVQNKINILGRRRLKVVATILAHPFSVASFPFVTGLLSWFSFFIPELAEEWRLVLIVAGTVAITFSLLLPIILRLMRYEILMSEVSNALKHLPFDEKSILIGVGGGSNKVLGMLQKAWQHKNPRKNFPRSICISLMARGDERQTFPALDDIRPLIHSHVCITLAQIGTGRTARMLREWLKDIEAVKSIDVISLIMSPSAAESGEWQDTYTLGVFERGRVKTSILPWVSTSDEF